ncbi:MAG: hypothetical protein ACK44W_05345, partial [Planctomycetota bacterium]
PPVRQVVESFLHAQKAADLYVPNYFLQVFSNLAAAVLGSESNRALDRGMAGAPARRTLEALERFDRVFGVLGAPRPAAGDGVPEEVRRLAEERQEARRRKDFAAADAARERLRALGWAVEDVKGGYKLKRL